MLIFVWLWLWETFISRKPNTNHLNGGSRAYELQNVPSDTVDEGNLCSEESSHCYVFAIVDDFPLYLQEHEPVEVAGIPWCDTNIQEFS